MSVIQVTDATFEQEVLKSDKPVMVDFWAPWCGPCRMIAPVVEGIANEYEAKLKAAKLNTDDNSTTAAEYGITGIPCLVFFKDGKEVERLVGFLPKEHIEKKVQNIIG
ncbi:MAG: thioredoxin [Candidatus Margulisiibacteriota bacterium]|nr:MAG: thioredoxin [Candidatus Margulisbacteria bacterium GWD2_39_127]OGI05578.1 MAG: thioredoxin [Candidatus Margulisbacteria bacterium GWF2_38_17]OGI07535.1 MAG: thioredoxin [Candidatus Margulisbacteria bacterium GWE2_39_32]PZM84896.1 MAG: thioredoxin [Candidatus Margulisiibacteriota bacterium]HAR64018.1 thioredoxin [Candidatus Margulisiibacteriota bacterium]